MNNIRKSVVSGSFYPSDQKQLQQMIDNYLQELPPKQENYEKILGVIAPHAGFVYSGKCAAYAYREVQGKDFDLAVVIAPSHQYGDFYFSVGNFDAYQTPLGLVTVHKELAEKLLMDSKFVFYPYAHNHEHSLEVQLPFLQTVLPGMPIVPILIGKQYDISSQYLSQKLIELFGDKISQVLFIISSDLSHYHSYEQAVKLDSVLADSIETLDSNKVFALISNGEAEACGFGGILTLMNIANALNYRKVKRLCYINSGDMSGDKSQVVGYLASIFYQ